MVDRLAPDRRSWLMSRVGAKNTTPELAVRRSLHRLGFRFRLHRRDLPGIPDIVLPRLRTVILVHGCFWHRHTKCKKASMPKSRTDFWRDKFRRNVLRDRKAKTALEQIGWKVIIVWECQTKDNQDLTNRLTAALVE